MLNRTVLSALIGTLVGPGSAFASVAPPELGDVAWSRDYGAAQRESADTGRPLLILFDEVPGCATCVRYGQAVLTHPLIVEAAESLFVPVAVYNNVSGHDRTVLNRFREPTWNNPVVRIVNAKEAPLAPRLAGRYDQRSLIEAMTTALSKAGRPVPNYLRLLQAELSAGRTEKALFAMHCFWTGQACLGGLEGVIATRTGWRDGREVVEVRYDPQVRSLKSLLTAARPCANYVYVDAANEAVARSVFKDRVGTGVEHRPSPKDDRYQLQRSVFARIPMTELQSQRVNSALGQRQDPRQWLSPRQVALVEAVARAPDRRWPALTGNLRADMRRLRAAGS